LLTYLTTKCPTLTPMWMSRMLATRHQLKSPTRQRTTMMLLHRRPTTMMKTTRTRSHKSLQSRDEEDEQGDRERAFSKRTLQNQAQMMEANQELPCAGGEAGRQVREVEVVVEAVGEEEGGKIRVRQ
jgi:hypothetical protein